MITYQESNIGKTHKAINFACTEDVRYLVFMNLCEKVCSLNTESGAQTYKFKGQTLYSFALIVRGDGDGLKLVHQHFNKFNAKLTPLELTPCEYLEQLLESV
jgi:hypothetical protein